MRIRLLCEGATEAGLRSLLNEAVDIRGCGIKITTYEGVGSLLRKLDGRIAAELQSGAQVVFCLVDYYHYPLPEDSRNLPTAQRLSAIKSNVTQRIDDSRRGAVRCHVAVHELEAWILADEEALSRRLKVTNLSPWPHPESVNDMRPPFKVLEELFRTRSPLKKRYVKPKDGIDLLMKADWQKVYNKCPTFKQLVDELREFCQQDIKN
jgi:hypothetical protein